MSTELPQSVTIGEKTYHFPWIAFVPRPSEEEEQSIESAIKENGVYPPLVWTDPNGNDCVIDGHTRLLIAARLGIPRVYVVRFNGTKEEAEIAAVAANAVHRDWTRETRLATVRSLFGEGWGQRKISRALGVSPSQTHYDLVHLGLIEKPANPTPEPAAEPDAAPEQPNEPTPLPESQDDAAEPAESPGGSDEPSPEQPAAPQPSGKAADKPPAPSVADRRQANIDKAKTLIQNLTKVASELNVFGDCQKHLDPLLDIFDACDKGRK